jgi:hypothetical protein
MTETICPKCGVTTVLRSTGYLASHNAPPNENGYIARCGNRWPAKETTIVLLTPDV